MISTAWLLTKLKTIALGKLWPVFGIRGRSVRDPVFVAKLNKLVDLIRRITCVDYYDQISLVSNQRKKHSFLGSCKQSKAKCVERKMQDIPGAHSIAAGPVSFF